MSWLQNVIGDWIGAHDGLLIHIGWDVVKIILLFIAARIAIGVLVRLEKRLLSLQNRLDERRRETLMSLFANVTRYTIYFIWLLTVLPLVGVHIAALLAGAGVAGIAIAFGAQSLIKDTLNGFFILFEDQYGIGDYVTINGVTGRVQSIGLRITCIKIWTGEVEIIPNGQVLQLTNFSKDNSIAVIEVNIGYQADTQQATAIMEGIVTRMKDEFDDIVGDVSVLGVQALNDSTITLRAIAECAPYTHYGIIREAKMRIHKAFRDAGIDMPYQKVVYVPEGVRDPAGSSNGGRNSVESSKAQTDDGVVKSEAVADGETTDSGPSPDQSTQHG